MVRDPRTRSETNTHRQSRAQDGSRGIVWGLAGSVFVHLFLIFFLRVVPLGGSEPMVLLENEAPITFHFANPVVAPTTDDPLQDSPFLPVEAQPDSAVNQPVPFSPPTPAPDSPSLASRPAEPTENRSQPPPIAELPVEREPPRDQEPAVDVAEQLEEDRGAARVDASAAAAVPQRTLDMERALREFGELLRNRPPATRAATGSDGTPSNVYVPQFDQLPATGFGMGNLTFESIDFDWNDYGRLIYQAIWRAWHKRLYVTVDDFEKWSAQTRIRGLHHQTAVRFVIESNGDVSEITIESESGCAPFDRSASDALAEVILPPLPPGFPRDREVVHARFLGQGSIFNLRPTLRAMRRAGYF